MLASRSAGSSGCSPTTCACWDLTRRTGRRGLSGRSQIPGGRGGARLCEAALVPIPIAACVLAAVACVYLLVAHGGYWRTGCRLPVGDGDAKGGGGDWPSVVAVVPARDEAAMLPLTLPSLLGQGYPGELAVVLVDDGSSDGTARVAESLVQTLGAELKVI